MAKNRMARMAFLTGFVLASSGWNSLVAAAEPAEQRGWRSDYDGATAEARKNGRPLLVHFHASWCGPCRQMETSVLNTSQVKELLATQVVGVKVDSDDRPDLVSKYGVTGLPTDVFISPDGKVLRKTVGSTSLADYVAQLEQVGQQFPGDGQVKLAKQESKPELRTVKISQTWIGLDGFSPVALAENKEWKKGLAKFTEVHDGVEYRFTSAAEREKFQDSPDEFAPQFLGCDPLILAERGQAVRGEIRFGAFYKDRVYLLATAENQQRFIDDPATYADQRFAVKFEDVRELTSSAVGK